MLDAYSGSLNLALLLSALSLALLFPSQFFLCRKVKSLFLRLLPVMLFACLALALVLLALAASGWDRLGYIFLSVYMGIPLGACGMGWGLWAILGKRKGQ